MRLKFQNLRQPSSVEELSEVEQLQLVAAGQAWDGKALSAEARLVDEPDSEQSFFGFISVWDVVDEEADGALVYTFFHYMVDSGCFFLPGRTDYDADVIQSYLHNPKSTELARAIASAVERQREELRAGRSGFRVSERMLQ